MRMKGLVQTVLLKKHKHWMPVNKRVMVQPDVLDTCLIQVRTNVQRKQHLLLDPDHCFQEQRRIILTH